MWWRRLVGGLGKKNGEEDDLKRRCFIEGIFVHFFKGIFVRK